MLVLDIMLRTILLNIPYTICIFILSVNQYSQFTVYYTLHAMLKFCMCFVGRILCGRSGFSDTDASTKAEPPTTEPRLGTCVKALMGASGSVHRVDRSPHR